MNIPLDRLYNFIDGLCNHDVLIYGFFPHGSKNLNDLGPVVDCTDWFELMSKPTLICHDQEPLNFDLYQLSDFQKAIRLKTQSHSVNQQIEQMHLRSLIRLPYNCFEKTLLLHSELNSTELHKYEKHGFIGVYWWSHAMIARDWYRYAEYDRALKYSSSNKDFLIYNRAWSGTREYRLKFSELLVNTNLVKHCLTRFNPVDHVHYSEHVYNNVDFSVSRYDLESFFEKNTYSSTSSAEYDAYEYSTCGIEVVLETLFDDTRNHLTEKILRPIACGCPFILASTPGSLQYLRNYGFETFGQFIDESYDNIQDPNMRLQAIVQEMKRISMLDPVEKQTLFENLRLIAARNKEVFFSKNWAGEITNELVENLNHALEQIWSSRTGSLWKKLKAETTGDFSNRSKYIKYNHGDKERLVAWLKSPVDPLKISL